VTGRMSSPDAGSRRGLTLLELMVAMTLLVVIMVIVSGAVRVSHRTTESGERRVELLERQRNSITIIDAQIQSEIPLTYEDEDGNRRPYFFAGRDLLTFASNYSLWGGRKGFVAVTYRVGANGSGKQALYARENTVGVENAKEAKLLDGFDEIYFEYFYKEPTEEEGTWIDFWPEDTEMPERIAINLVKGKVLRMLIIPMKTRPRAGQTTVTGER
jgi:general secretion pathway protein J